MGHIALHVRVTPARRYDTRKDIKFTPGSPVIGLVLQRSHLVTGDEGHYSGVVAELEANGAKVGCGTYGLCVGCGAMCGIIGYLGTPCVFVQIDWLSES
jgi:hypothetical protein